MNIINGLVFDLKEGFKARELYTDQDRIAERSGDDRTIDASGCYIIPSLVDLTFMALLVRISVTHLRKDCRKLRIISFRRGSLTSARHP